MATSYIPKIVYDPGGGDQTIEFEVPPEGDPFGKSYEPSQVIRESGSGIQQTLTDFIAIENEVTFAFISEAIKTSLETFLETFAIFGNTFDYYFDKDDAATKITVTLAKNSRKPDFEVITRRGTGFIYRLQLTFRRVI